KHLKTNWLRIVIQNGGADTQNSHFGRDQVPKGYGVRGIGNINFEMTVGRAHTQYHVLSQILHSMHDALDGDPLAILRAVDESLPRDFWRRRHLAFADHLNVGRLHDRQIAALPCETGNFDSRAKRYRSVIIRPVDKYGRRACHRTLAG